ncbi:MAG: DUF2058 family protein [Thiofilum sp.]|uniref:DUF2058 family protein n=1 Tax=Thiofilum sp. TaxID=2212733 RepID=UPI0025F0ECF6|nr:DUF2058 family protein [Thiofilum sp.]MBK8452540.1 DUF2058 family protein [Thiofilum sp.]
MSNSLRDQLLKAGLATQAQVDKAEQEKQKPQTKKPQERLEKRESPARPSKPQPAPTAKKPAPKSEEDLAQFYSARDKAEREEKLEQERRQREASERKKQLRQQVKTLLEGQILNQPEAEIRYNFVVGETIKYLYVTAEQQTQLAQGQLAITFLEGKRCLISLELAQQIKAIDPDKLIVIADPNDESDIPLEIPEESESVTPTETQGQAV